MIKGALLRRMPWTSDMTIESQINILMAGEARHKGAPVLANVMNPTPKLECADVAPDREWTMMNYCAQHHLDMISECARQKVVLAGFELSNIRQTNEVLSGTASYGMITNEPAHTANIPFGSARPIILPSIAALREHKLVNWKGVLEAADRNTRAMRGM